MLIFNSTIMITHLYSWRVASQFFLVSSNSHDRGLGSSLVPLPLGRLRRCLRRSDVLNEKWKKQVQQNDFEGPFCLFCTFTFRNEKNWIKKSARVSEKLVSPGFTWLTGSYAPVQRQIRYWQSLRKRRLSNKPRSRDFSYSYLLTTHSFVLLS